MKRLLFILFIISFGPAQSQNLYTNEPDLVYPILEEFIAENFKNESPTFYLINTIDSIVVKDIPLIVEDYKIKRVYGYHYRTGIYSRIELDSSLLQYPAHFKKTLKHELGHVFGLKHILTEGLPLDDPMYNEIMSETHLMYYVDPKELERANYNYYKSLQKIKK